MGWCFHLLRVVALAGGLAAGCIGCGAASAASLFDELGGRPGLVGIVDSSMQNFLTDPRIKDDFDNINLVRLKGRLVDLFCQMTGGPCVYPGRAMGPAHKGLHLGTAEFNALVEGLQRGMEQRGVPFRVQNRLLAMLAPMYRDVVTR